MKRQTKRILTVLSILVLTVALFTSTALADSGDPTGEPGNSNGLARMVEWMGPENWGRMVQRMTQFHGPEFTGQMLQQMNESGGCHNFDGTGSGFMRGRGFDGGMWNNGVDEQVEPGFQGGMMGRGFHR